MPHMPGNPYAANLDPGTAHDNQRTVARAMLAVAHEVRIQNLLSLALIQQQMGIGTDLRGAHPYALLAEAADRLGIEGWPGR